jgi:aminopeptidase N
MRRLLPLLLLPLIAQAEAPLQAERRGDVSPDRAFDAQKLRLAVVLDPKGRQLDGTATWTVERLFDGPLVLDQVALDIRRVYSGDADLVWRVEGDLLLVEVPSARGEVLPVSVDYHATPRNGLHFREATAIKGRAADGGWAEVWSQGEGTDNRYWFPLWDHPGDRFEYQGQVSLAKGNPGWLAATNSGVDLVGYLVMLAAGQYTSVGEPDNQVWVGPAIPLENAQRAAAGIPDMTRHFAARTGVAWPWPSYRQVFVQRFLYTGMENTAATIEDTRLLVGPARFGGPGGRGAQSVYAHELAHQWYGDLLTCRTWRELWLNEGFATFFGADWMASRRDGDLLALGPHGQPTELTARYAESVRGWRRASVDDPHAMVGRFHQGPDAPDSYNVYARGAMVLHMLRAMLGEDAFWDGIRRYTTAHANGLVETGDLRRAMEDSSGRSLDWFFSQWTELPGAPTVKLSQRSEAGALHVSLTQVPGEGRAAWTLPIDVEVGVEGGPPQRVSGWLDGPQLELVLPLEEPPLYVGLDPDGALLARVEVSQGPLAWTAQLQSPSAHLRLAAIDALGKDGPAAPLEAVLADRERGAVERSAAARALGELRAGASLRAAAQERDAEVRYAMVEGLGRVPDDSLLPVLGGIARSDADSDVGAAALRSLARLSPSTSVRLAREWLALSGRDDRVRVSAAIGVLGEHGEPRDVKALLQLTGHDRVDQEGRVAAARIVARQPTGPATDLLRKQVARAAEPLLDSTDLRTREAMVALLGEVGDDRSADLLMAFRTKEEIESLRVSVVAAVARIAARKAAPPTPPAQADARIEALEKRLDELERDQKRQADRH